MTPGQCGLFLAYVNGANGNKAGGNKTGADDIGTGHA